MTDHLLNNEILKIVLIISQQEIFSRLEKSECLIWNV